VLVVTLVYLIYNEPLAGRLTARQSLITVTTWERRAMLADRAG
jgi:hypothetical protein